MTMTKVSGVKLPPYKTYDHTVNSAIISKQIATYPSVSNGRYKMLTSFATERI